MRIFDLHNDYLSYNNQQKNEKLLQKYLNNNVYGLVSSVYTTDKTYAKILSSVMQYKYHVETLENAGVSSHLLLSFEDLAFLNNENFNSVLLAKPTMCSLTWNFDNNLAGGVLGQNGLSSFGDKVVSALEAENILIDCAHLNERSFLDIAKVSKRPLLCSHSAFFSVCEHFRNLKDYQIRIILESGGIIGLCFVSYFLSSAKKVYLDDYIKHILYYANSFGGVDGLCIGTDFFGTKHLPKNANGYDCFKYISDSLINLGFTDDDIDKLFYSNAAKLLLQ